MEINYIIIHQGNPKKAEGACTAISPSLLAYVSINIQARIRWAIIADRQQTNQTYCCKWIRSNLAWVLSTNNSINAHASCISSSLMMCSTYGEYKPIGMRMINNLRLKGNRYKITNRNGRRKTGMDIRALISSFHHWIKGYLNSGKLIFVIAN